MKKEGLVEAPGIVESPREIAEFFKDLARSPEFGRRWMESRSHQARLFQESLSEHSLQSLGLPLVSTPLQRTDWELATLATPELRVAFSHLEQFSKQLGMSGEAETIAIRILQVARWLRLTCGRSPRSLACASTYIATMLAGERRLQREIAKIGNVTEAAIRARCRELLEKLMIEVQV